MAAGVGPARPQRGRRLAQLVLQLGAAHAGLDGYRVVALIEGYDPVQVHPHVQAHAAPDRLDAARDRRAAAVDIDRYAMPLAIIDNGPEVCPRAWPEHDVRKILDDAGAQAREVDHGLAVGNAQAVPGVRVGIVGANDGGKCGDMLRVEPRWRRFGDDIHARGPRVPEPVVVEPERPLHQSVEGTVRMLVRHGITPLEDGAETLPGQLTFKPIGFKLIDAAHASLLCGTTAGHLRQGRRLR